MQQVKGTRGMQQQSEKCVPEKRPNDSPRWKKKKPLRNIRLKIGHSKQGTKLKHFGTEHRKVEVSPFNAGSQTKHLRRPHVAPGIEVTGIERRFVNITIS